MQVKNATAWRFYDCKSVFLYFEKEGHVLGEVCHIFQSPHMIIYCQLGIQVHHSEKGLGHDTL